MELLENIKKELISKTIKGKEIRDVQIPKNKPGVPFLGMIKGNGNNYFSIFTINHNNITNKNKINEILTTYRSLSTKKSKFILLIIAYDNDENIVLNPLTQQPYYEESDFDNILNEITYQPNIKNDIMIFNPDKSKEIYDKYIKNPIIQELFNEEFGHKSVIGRVIYLCNLFNPTSCYDLVNQYYNYAEDNKSKLIKDRGLTRTEMYNKAHEFARRVAERTEMKIMMTPEEGFHFLMNRIINITYCGYKAEKIYSEELIKQGFLVKKTDEYDDREYGIDLKAEINGEVYFYQIKPNNFLSSNDFEDIINKHEKTLKKYGKEIIYSFYEKKDENYCWIINNENNTTYFGVEVFKK